MPSTDERPLSVDRVPTLTEVVDIGGLPAPLSPLLPVLPVPAAVPPAVTDWDGPVPDLSDDARALGDDLASAVCEAEGSSNGQGVPGSFDWITGGLAPAAARSGPAGDAFAADALAHDAPAADGPAPAACPLDACPPQVLAPQPSVDAVGDVLHGGLPGQPAAALVEQVLQELAPRIDRLFEDQLRDALAPALERAVDGLLRDARTDLGVALRSLVEQSVARVLAQRRQG